MAYGLEYFRRYYGPYKGRVVNNRDPKKLGRIKVYCPRAKLSRNNSIWVLPMSSFSGDGYGSFFPPEEGDVVWIFFENGDPTTPLCYMGGWYSRGELDEKFRPGDDGPKRRGFQTPGGHSVVMDDTEGSRSVKIRHRSGSIIEMDEDGKIRIGDEDGSFEPLLRGDTVKQWLETHTHPHSWGDTAPPRQRFPSNGLSSDNETS